MPPGGLAINPKCGLGLKLLSPDLFSSKRKRKERFINGAAPLLGSLSVLKTLL